MRDRSITIIPWLLGFIFMGIFTVSLTAQDFQINQVSAYLLDDSLQIDITITDLLVNQIRKTLLSGLPINMGVELILSDQNQKEIVKNQYAGNLNYDVWEERFRIIDFWGNEIEFELLEGVNKWVENLGAFALLPKNKLYSGTSYQVLAKLEVLLTTRKQNQQLKWWLGKSDPTEEEIASEERSTGFKLNLNQLVQMFFSSNEGPDKYSVTRMSNVFRLEDLEFQ